MSHPDDERAEDESTGHGGYSAEGLRHVTDALHSRQRRTLLAAAILAAAIIVLALAVFL